METPRRAEDRKQSFIFGDSEGAVSRGTGRTSVTDVKVHGALVGHRGRGNSGGRHLVPGYSMEELASCMQLHCGIFISLFSSSNEY